MKIVFFSNYLNHHQLPLAEAFNSIDGIDYTFVSISGLPEFRKELGYKEISAPFMLDVTKSEANRQQAKELALKADIAIFSTSRTKEYIVPRLKSGKLTFEYSERWFKKDYKCYLDWICITKTEGRPICICFVRVHMRQMTIIY